MFQIARIASTISRIRGAGWLHSIENRFVMCGLIWLPRPRMKRPFEYAWRSQASVGERHRIAGERDGDRRAELERLGVLGRQQQREERVVRRLGRPRAGVAGGLHLLRVLRHVAKVHADVAVDLHEPRR